MSERYFIGLDNGGTVTKAGLFDEKGVEIAISSITAQLITPQQHYVERDSEDLFQSNLHCLKDVIKKAGVPAKKVKAISVTGHGNGIYLVGFDGKPSYNGIISTDTRADECVQKWNEDGIFEKTLPITKQVMWAGQLIPLLAWLQNHRREILEKSQYAFSCTDYLRFRLTGNAQGEITNMSGINAMNLENCTYDEKVLSLFGLNESKRLLPPICMSSEICGGITEEVARETGLEAGTPVAGGLFDVVACPLATGVTDEDYLSIVVGTWSMVTCLSKKPVADKNLLMTCLYPVDGYYLLVEGSMTSANNLDWFIKELMYNAAEGAESEKSVYRLCDELVASLKPEEVPIIFLPFLFGTNVNANARACFVGMNYLHKKAHMLRAIYEGVAFSALTHVERLMRFRQQTPKAVRMSGGVAKSKEWVQIFADVLQMPIEISDARELGAMGAAMCAAVGTEEYKSYEEAMAAFVKIKSVVVPNSANKGIYEKKFNQYKKLVSNLDGVWKDWD